MPANNAQMQDYTARIYSSADPALEHGGQLRVITVTVAASSTEEAEEIIIAAAAGRGIEIRRVGRIHRAHPSAEGVLPLEAALDQLA